MTKPIHEQDDAEIQRRMILKNQQTIMRVLQVLLSTVYTPGAEAAGMELIFDIE